MSTAFAVAALIGIAFGLTGGLVMNRAKDPPTAFFGMALLMIGVAACAVTGLGALILAVL